MNFLSPHFPPQKSSGPPPNTEALNSKRYLILTYSVEFDRIHYPLPLPYLGKPDPVALLQVKRTFLYLISYVNFAVEEVLMMLYYNYLDDTGVAP